MTFFDREQSLTEIEVNEIVTVMKESTLLELESPFSVELQTGRTESVTKIKREDDDTIIFITADGQFPVARIEFNSLEELVQQRIKTDQFLLSN